MNGGKMVKAVSECKELRRCGLCPRECVAWHTHSRTGRQEFCRRAMRAERAADRRRFHS